MTQQLFYENMWASSLLSACNKANFICLGRYSWHLNLEALALNPQHANKSALTVGQAAKTKQIL